MAKDFSVYAAEPSGREHRIASIGRNSRAWRTKARELLAKHPNTERVLIRDALGGLWAEFTRERASLTPTGR